ncbi:MAG: hypothetical protein NXI22_24595, partial [bacterium]|nr:hypothetical protein [bacterium]
MRVLSNFQRHFMMGIPRLASSAVAVAIVLTSLAQTQAQSPGLKVGSLTDAHFQVADSEPLTVRGQSCSSCENGFDTGDCCGAGQGCCESFPCPTLVVYTAWDSFGNKGDDNGSANMGARQAINYGRAI